MKLHTINTGLFKLDGGAMFGVVPRSIWEKLTTPDAKGLCTWAMRCLLIEDGKQLILIDTGLGNKQSEKFFAHYEPHGDDSLEGSLRKLGFHEDDITDVILTHLHFDHCGGAIKRNGEKLIPLFKNALYWSNEQHWLWATKPNAREKASFLSENILPIQESGQLKFADKNSFSVHPEIQLLCASGHTESMFTPLIHFNEKKILYGADLIPSQWHIPIPYVMAYDTRPLITLEEKQQILNTCFTNDYAIFLEHDPFTEMITLKNDQGKILVNEKTSLENF